MYVCHATRDSLRGCLAAGYYLRFLSGHHRNLLLRDKLSLSIDSPRHMTFCKFQLQPLFPAWSFSGWFVGGVKLRYHVNLIWMMLWQTFDSVRYPCSGREFKSHEPSINNISYVIKISNVVIFPQVPRYENDEYSSILFSVFRCSQDTGWFAAGAWNEPLR